MLARLQQLTTLGLGLLALLWAIAWWRDGHPGWAVAGAALIVAGYALILGVEFLLLARINRGDACPPATTRQVLLAWWGEVRSAPEVFCWRQPFFSGRWPDRLDADARGHRGLLLVHGFVCNRGLWNRWYPRLRAAGVPYLGINMEPVFGSIDEYVPAIEAAVLRIEQATGLPPVIVAHSMGGVAVRRWWAEQSAAGRVHRLVTIGSPHRGTWLAGAAFSPNGRQMRLDSRWLEALASRETIEHRRRTTCFYSHCDNIVFPSSRATLPDADNRHVIGAAHVHMADRNEPFEEVMRWVAPARHPEAVATALSSATAPDLRPD
jgi:triacylglycerol lipase